MNDFALSSTLRQIPYFAHVSQHLLAMLAEQALRRVFAAGAVIFLEGEASAGLWLLENGRVKAYKLSPDGQEYILRFFGPG